MCGNVINCYSDVYILYQGTRVVVEQGKSTSLQQKHVSDCKELEYNELDFFVLSLKSVFVFILSIWASGLCLLHFDMIRSWTIRRLLNFVEREDDEWYSVRFSKCFTGEGEFGYVPTVLSDVLPVAKWDHVSCFLIRISNSYR